MRLFSWGANSHGQLGQGLICEQILEPQAINIDFKVKSIVGGGKHTILLSESGELLACGDNSKGQLSLDSKSVNTFQSITFGHKIRKISCGWDFTLAISEDNYVFGWGGNAFGQLGLSEEVLFVSKPTNVFNGKAIDVSAGLRHSVIISDDGLVFCSGFGKKGQIGILLDDDKKKTVNSFLQVHSIKNACKTSCGENHTVVCTEEGNIYCWGDNKFSQLGVDPKVKSQCGEPVLIDCQNWRGKIKAIVSGWAHNAILTDEGKVVTWGRNDYGQLGEERVENWKPKIVKSLDGTKQIALGSNHGVALKRDGTLLCWGWNEHGNCGNDLSEDIEDVDVNYHKIEEIPRFKANDLLYSTFFAKYLARNTPAVLENATAGWKSQTLWVSGNTLNVDYFLENYGNAEVAVANCGKRWYNVQEKCTMMMRDYLAYWEQYRKQPSLDMDCLYLKDWHFTKDFPAEDMYRVPSFFASDWLNEYYDNNNYLNDDFRFVYIGPKDSWTPFHSDVMTSFSWSGNVSGRKKWILLPPGEEEYFKDDMGNLGYDIDITGTPDGDRPKLFEVVQEPGEVIFVPSGWHHQVWNLDDAVSINHNWINGCNIRFVWDSLRSNLSDVKKEISDCRDAENWNGDCQKILLASFGFDYYRFFDFLHQTATVRMEKLSNHQSLVVYGNWSLGRKQLIFDLRRILFVLAMVIEDDDFRMLDRKMMEVDPAKFLKSLETFLSRV